VITANLNGDGMVETIELIKVPSEDNGGSSAEGTIIVKARGRQWKKDVGLLEFSDMSYIDVVMASKSSRPYIGLYSFGGAHSMTLSLYCLNGDELKEEISIFSDAPSIEIKDVDNDGSNEIIAKMRDYDKDPIADSYIITYKYRDGSWSKRESKCLKPIVRSSPNIKSFLFKKKGVSSPRQKDAVKGKLTSLFSVT